MKSWSKVLPSKKVLALLGVVVAALLAGSVLASVRNVDGDEGFYALASRLTTQGSTPYLDFFYPQMPGLPYVYGLWMRIFGFSWVSGRLFSVLFYVLSLLLFGNYLRTRGHNWPGILFLGGLYGGNGLVLAWATVIKTFAPSLFILVATFVALLQWTTLSQNGRDRRSWLFVAGLALGLGINVRLMLLPLLAFLTFWVFCSSWHCGPRRAGLNTLAFVSGTIVALLPAIWLYWQSPWQFVLNNIGYHLGRHGQTGLIYDFSQKLEVLKQLASLRQVWPLLILSALGLALTYWPRPTACQSAGNMPVGLALTFLAVLGITSWAVPPSFTQYFCLLLPFVVVLIGPLVQRLRHAWPLCWQILIGAAFLAGYFATSPADIRDEIKRVGIHNPEYRLPVINYISQFIAEHTEPQAVIVSWWPGYVFTNQRNIYPGMENHFSRGLAEGVSIREGIPLEMARTWTRTASDKEILSTIAKGQADVVVVGIWQHRIGQHRPRLEALLAEHYTLAVRVYTASVYLKSPANTP